MFTIDSLIQQKQEQRVQLQQQLEQIKEKHTELTNQVKDLEKVFERNNAVLQYIDKELESLKSEITEENKTQEDVENIESFDKNA